MAAIQLEDMTTEAFAPFGDSFLTPQSEEARLDLIDQLQNLREVGKPRLSMLTVNPKTLPLLVPKLERHVFSSQAFIPGGCNSYLVIVAPHDEAGFPNAARAKAFRVPGNICINYKANIWHAPIASLATPASFVILTFIDGTTNDEEFVALPEALTITS